MTSELCLQYVFVNLTQAKPYEKPNGRAKLFGKGLLKLTVQRENMNAKNDARIKES